LHQGHRPPVRTRGRMPRRAHRAGHGGRCGSRHRRGAHHRQSRRVTRPLNPMRVTRARTPGRPMKRTSQMTAALAAAVTLAVGAGCTNASQTGSTEKAKPGFSAQAADKTLSAMVPAKIRTAGTIRVATDATYPPFESVAKDNKTLEGADIDLIKGIASLLGLKAGLQNASFDAIVPGIAAGKFDVAVSGILDRPSRREHIDFVDYAMNSTMFFAKAE